VPTDATVAPVIVLADVPALPMVLTDPGVAEPMLLAGPMRSLETVAINELETPAFSTLLPAVAPMLLLPVLAVMLLAIPLTVLVEVVRLPMLLAVFAADVPTLLVVATRLLVRAVNVLTPSTVLAEMLFWPDVPAAIRLLLLPCKVLLDTPAWPMATAVEPAAPVPVLVALIRVISGVNNLPTARTAEASFKVRDDELVPPVNEVLAAPMVRPCAGLPATLFVNETVFPVASIFKPDAAAPPAVTPNSETLPASLTVKP